VDLCRNSPIPPNMVQPLKPKIGMGENLSFALWIVIQFKTSHHGHGIGIHEITLHLMNIHGINNFHCFGHGSQMPVFQGNFFLLLKKNGNFIATSFTITWGIGKEVTHSRMGCDHYKLKEHICWVPIPTFLEGS
jgi:hypothetical protein